MIGLERRHGLGAGEHQGRLGGGLSGLQQHRLGAVEAGLIAVAADLAGGETAREAGLRLLGGQRHQPVFVGDAQPHRVFIGLGLGLLEPGRVFQLVQLLAVRAEGADRALQHDAVAAERRLAVGGLG